MATKPETILNRREQMIVDNLDPNQKFLLTKLADITSDIKQSQDNTIPSIKDPRFLYGLAAQTIFELTDAGLDIKTIKAINQTPASEAEETVIALSKKDGIIFEADKILSSLDLEFKRPTKD